MTSPVWNDMCAIAVGVVGEVEISGWKNETKDSQFDMIGMICRIFCLFFWGWIFPVNPTLNGKLVKHHHRISGQ